MSATEFSLALSVFLACAVEAVEAFTIVLAVGTTRRWPPALAGTGAAVLVLAVLVAALGPALTTLPIGVLRVVVGGLLLTFGLQWLRKAILRAAGAKDRHDEEAIFREEAAEAATAPPPAGFDGYAFAISFKAVLLEGLEVAFIVLTFGANQHDVGLAAAAAALAVLVVLAAGLGIAGAAGAGARERDEVRRRRDAHRLRDLLGRRGRRGVLARRRGEPRASGRPHPPGGPGAGRRGPLAPGPRRGGGVSASRALVAVRDFVVGDDPRLALAAVTAIGATAIVAALGSPAWWVAPPVALGALWWSLRSAIPLSFVAHRATKDRGSRNPGATITQCDTSVSDLPTQDSSSSPASPPGRSTDTR